MKVQKGAKQSVRPVRALALLLLAVGDSYAQKFGVQLLTGIPISGYRETTVGRSSILESFSNYYIAGVSGELRITKYFGARVETLYRRVHIFGYAGGNPFPVWKIRANGSALEIPFLAKYSILDKTISPFLIAGPSLRRVGLEGELTREYVAGSGRVETTSRLAKGTMVTAGWILGGGLDMKAGRVRLSPQVWYARLGEGLDCRGCGFPETLIFPVWTRFT
jgi:hypothetical protein